MKLGYSNNFLKQNDSEAMHDGNTSILSTHCPLSFSDTTLRLPVDKEMTSHTIYIIHTTAVE
jgi:hypothetical protein